MTRRERKEAKAERLRTWAEKRTTAATSTLTTIADKYRGDHAFNFQPGHIPARARVNAAQDRAFESLNKAGSMDARADGIDRQLADTIFSDDPDAIEALKVKVARLKVNQDRMKAVNAAIRKHAKAGKDAQIAALVALGMDTATAKIRVDPDHCGHIGYAPYETTNNGANIRRLEGRIAQLEREATEGKPWRYYGQSKYPGTCVTCGQPIEKGSAIVYRDGEVKHFECATTKHATLPAIPGIAPAVDLDPDEAAFFASIEA